jgi:hypothetical protein
MVQEINEETKKAFNQYIDSCETVDVFDRKIKQALPENLKHIENVIGYGMSVLKEAISKSSENSREKTHFNEITTCLSKVDELNKFNETTLKNLLKEINKLLNIDTHELTDPQLTKKLCFDLYAVLRLLQHKISTLSNMDRNLLQEKGIKTEDLNKNINSLLKKVTKYIENLNVRIEDQVSMNFSPRM